MIWRKEGEVGCALSEDGAVHVGKAHDGHQILQQGVGQEAARVHPQLRALHATMSHQLQRHLILLVPNPVDVIVQRPELGGLACPQACPVQPHMAAHMTRPLG